MASPTFDKSGNKIVSDILVYGYIHQDIEPTLSKQIPNELKDLCFIYWLYKACDSWCDQYHTQKMIAINEEEINVLYN